MPYNPVGKCIYGPDHAPGPDGFTDEHIIPFSLGGMDILPAASCADCRDETHAFEGVCAGQILKNTRTHFYWQSRKSKRPQTLELTKRGYPPRQVPIADHPPLVVLPVFRAPGFLLGLSEEESAGGSMKCTDWAIARRPDLAEKMRHLDGDSVGTTFILKPFARMLAKIAHSFTVATIGLESFEPFLPKIILGHSSHYGHYIGNVPSPLFPSEEVDNPKLHSLALWTRGEGAIAVHVWLYAQYRGPVYTVISGRLMPEISRIINLTKRR